MKLSYFIEVAEEFGKKIWPVKNKLKIKDLMLYGSLTYKKRNPHDVDMLILHSSKILEKFQDIADSKIADSKKLIILSRILRKKLNLIKIFEGSQTKELIDSRKFNIKFMNIKFFTNKYYKIKWIKRNLRLHGNKKKKARLSGETFEECIFRQGLLWNPKTQEYDIPALKKYRL